MNKKLNINFICSLNGQILDLGLNAYIKCLSVEYCYHWYFNIFLQVLLDQINSYCR